MPKIVGMKSIFCGIYCDVFYDTIASNLYSLIKTYVITCKFLVYLCYHALQEHVRNDRTSRVGWCILVGDAV